MDDASERPRWSPWVPPVAAAKLALHLAAISTAYGVFRDEFYYLACARHLAWGYVDHPPLSIAVLALDRALFGEGLIALRWIPALCGTAAVLLAAALARELGGKSWAQGLAAVAALVAPVCIGVDSTFSMNVFEPLFWMGIALALAKLVNGAPPRTWLAIGALAGLGVLDKHSTAFFVGAFVVGVLATQLRTRMRCKEFALGLGLAIVLVAPHVAWQVAHGWPTLEFLRNAQEHKNYLVSPLEFAQGQFESSHPLAFPLLVAGWLALLFAPRLRAYRSLGIGALVLVVFMLVQHAKAYYVAPLYPLLFAAGAVFVERWIASKLSRVVATAYIALLLGTGALVLPLATPLLAPEKYVEYAKRFGVETVQSERHAMGPLPQYYADMFGWRELAQDVSRIYTALPESERAHCIVFTGNYGEAGAIEYFAREFPTPPVCSGHNNYFLWGIPPDDIDVVVVISDAREDHLDSFEDVTAAAVHRHAWAMPYESDLTLFVCRRPRRPVAELFAATKHYE
jgi:hypothetical protein